MPESGRELALGLAVFGRQRHQHPVGPGLHTDAAHPPLKLACDVLAELRQQKLDAFVERGNASRMILRTPHTSTSDDSHVQ
jgi:hypothetical protein